MKNALLVAAIFLGLIAGEFLAKNFWTRATIAQIVRRGELLAIVQGRGIYDRDVERAWQAQLYDQGLEPNDVPIALAQTQKNSALAQLIERAKLDAAAREQKLSGHAVDREIDLLRWQFAPPRAWDFRLRYDLRREIAANLRARVWIESRLAGKISPNEKHCREFYDAHLDWFREPLRFRASHIFLAAPVGYPDEVIKTKRALIENLSARLTSGEDFPALAARFSDDEETKNRGGDLNYFAEERMLPAVFETAQSLGIGEISAPVRSRLGFHILRLTEKLPAAQLDFAQVAPEIATILENDERAKDVNALVAHLGGKIQFAARGN
jgi:peptidyl-prolyl cis-trans isomerase C